jgi:hypothetical protein
MKKFLFAFAFIVLLSGCSLYQPATNTNQPSTNTNLPIINQPVACDQDAKLCPDGSAVGRTGPNCEFAACPGENNQTGTVSGKVTLGPTCPVERIPPDPACAPKPYQTIIQIIALNSPQSAPFKVISSDAQGNYTVTLPAGAYNFQPQGGNTLPRCGNQEITVTAGANLNVDFSCDTGIR